MLQITKSNHNRVQLEKSISAISTYLIIKSLLKYYKKHITKLSDTIT